MGECRVPLHNPQDRYKDWTLTLNLTLTQTLIDSTQGLRGIRGPSIPGTRGEVFSLTLMLTLIGPISLELAAFSLTLTLTLIGRLTSSLEERGSRGLTTLYDTEAPTGTPSLNLTLKPTLVPTRGWGGGPLLSDP